MNDHYPMDRQVLLTISRMDSLARRLRHRQVDELAGRLEALAEDLDAHSLESLMGPGSDFEPVASHTSGIRVKGS